MSDLICRSCSNSGIDMFGNVCACQRKRPGSDTIEAKLPQPERGPTGLPSYREALKELSELREWRHAALFALKVLVLPPCPGDITNVGVNTYTIRLAQKLCQVVIDPDTERPQEMIKTLRCSCDMCCTITYCSLENGGEWLCNACLVRRAEGPQRTG